MRTPRRSWRCRAQVQVAALAAAAVLAQGPAVAGEYLPRLLYPGTYGNYCGPTPEFPRGWRGDSPIDAVDRACCNHDAAYVGCAQGLRARRGVTVPSTRLSILSALRATGRTTPILESLGADDESPGRPEL